MDLAGRVALVTGSGSGIGRATAERLTAEGMRVCVVDVIGDAAESVSARIGGLAITADVSDRDQLDAAFDRCVATFGRLDVVHLNAGVSLGAGDIAELDVEGYRRSIGVNVDHVVFGTSAAVRAIRRSEPDGGPRAVVATASIAGLEPFYPDAIYTLTKHAVVGFIRAVAPDLARDGIAAHVVCPGLTDTGMLNPERKKILLGAGMPLVEPERIADAVVAAILSPLEATGTCWVGNPDELPLPWNFAPVPGPHGAINKPRSR
jgi:NAD(P)-dependent dehydrogenase (short-subunit alcohol dehydrogenase family)